MAKRILLRAELPPLRQDAHGDLRVGTSRVLLDVVLDAFLDGATPESIAERYPTASLADYYGAIAYFLRHEEEIEAYLEEREQRAGKVRAIIESSPDLSDLRRRLLARRRSSGRRGAEHGDGS